MTQRILSIAALFISLSWVVILFRGLPPMISDPDGELVVIVLILLDFLVLVIGGVLAVSTFKRKTSCWIALAVLAIPAMHALGSIVESPLNLVCFFCPIGVLPIIILIKRNSAIAVREGVTH